MEKIPKHIMFSDEVLLTRDEAAKFLKVKPSTLRNWAALDPMPIPFYKLGGWHVRYKKSDLLLYLSGRRIESHEDYKRTKRKIRYHFKKKS